ncbi:hypothetical protein ACMU_10855 [Actibacterium mucosum KCTC 23349]|uniref:Lipoprotein n=1 Tax=Actibacterium mucosum KCTC 23349 TaxID=1454373 RepID=A0A037ZJF6_9RHOB|nr:DUF3833 domain-containing protein [Actibacterium mucosum]KAJ56243.1 hypothetical protein ACMU_10855 [Actibacterium mucosum KCTC 23349]
MLIVLAVLILAFVTLALLWPRLLSFRAQRPGEYQTTQPGFDIRRHFDGPIKCEGMVFGPTGRMVGRFVADMQGSWQGAKGTLAESFRYASGAAQNREWHLTMGENGAFTATADDVIGAAQGQQSGATVRMTYRLKLDEDAGGHVLDVTDWMYLMDDGSIMNKSEMRKFGIKVAELIATMRPAPGHA